jgi:MFS transporter, ACS family, hexuronate transporter
VVGPSSPSSSSQEDAAATTSVSLAAPSAPGGVIRASVGHFRWVICALLLCATVKSYMDRNVLASLKHTLQPILGWNDIDYGHIVAAFQLFYAFGMLIAGRMVDRLGTRKAFSIFMVVWSLAAMSYGIAPRLAVLVGSTFYYLHGLWSFFPAAHGTVAGFIVVSAAMG